MSRETATHLNTQTLIGFTESRGNAWHYRAELQGAESNHYTGAIPIADVTRRLFDWQAIPVNIYADVPGFGMPQLTDRQGIAHSGTGDVFGIFKLGYTVHQYQEWLMGQIGNILDDDLSIGSAGLLRSGAQAWVSVEVPDSITTPEGIEYRPHLLACTSHDGSLSTTYKRVVTNVVCDNTMSAALGETAQQIKIKHSRYSHLRLSEARNALAIVHTISEDFAAQVKALCETTVTDRAWSQFLDAHSPVPEKDGRAATMATNQREDLTQLWNSDTRVSPWRNTAYGVIQAVNTFTHHKGIVRGATRPERNMSRAITGGVDTLDQTTFDTLNRVLSAAV